MPFTSEEQNNFLLQFLLLDADNDGQIQSSQLGTFLRSVGYHPSLSDLQSLTGILDPTGSGLISKEVLLESADSLSSLRIPVEAVREAFKVLDEDHDGYVTAAQMRHILTNLGGEQLTNEEADGVLKDVVMDQDTQIDIDDFTEMIMNVKPLTELCH